MIYLRTGANGSGKTLLTLKDVYDKSVKESRPVYHNGRFEVAPDGPLTAWTKHDFNDWQSLPDGSIFIVDECHNEMPPRASSAPVPAAIKALAEHRRRGFDFYLITQHPLNFDSFVRRLIGSPGWHQHLKRASGAPLVSVLQWAAVNERPEKAGSGASAQVSMVSYPKEVYKWYVSTSLDTAKIKVPFALKLLVAVVVIVPILGYLVYGRIQAMAEPKPLPGAVAGAPGYSGVAGPVGAVAAGPAALTPAAYLGSFAPRLEGLPHTAPRYDDLTKPTVAPFPAACISSANSCQCYTQQTTKMAMSDSLCRQIVKNGYFNDNPPTVSGGRELPPQLQNVKSVDQSLSQPQNTTSALNDGQVLASMKDPAI